MRQAAARQAAIPAGPSCAGAAFFAERPAILAEVAWRVRAWWEWLGGLSLRELSPSERTRLGGRIHRDAPLLVHSVAQALGERPDLAEDTGVTAAALMEQQARAHALLELREQLLSMAQLAGDGYLAAQAGAADGAMQVLGRLREPRRDLGIEERRGRAEALLPALTILLRRRERAERGLKRWLKGKRSAGIEEDDGPGG